ncbi:type II toxin-antitoxin system RelE/ParE family toxin [Corynebacterium sp. L4756]|uniref:type II toxin-antitoxin system RelE/ParE family toxin n=1 Tax=unclassified Corynebacterium TaxID=2624378 RepID=UPI00374DD49E
MSKYLLTPAAQRDLSAIWNFTEEQWSSAQAEKYLREIQRALERVTEAVARGRRRDDVRAGYMSYAVGSHIIFYRHQESHLEVIRILHHRMDHRQHL